MNVLTTSSPIALKRQVIFSCTTEGGAIILNSITIGDNDSVPLTPGEPIEFSLSLGVHECRVDIMAKVRSGKSLNRHFGVIISANEKPIATAIGNISSDKNDDFGHSLLMIEVK